MEKEYLIHSRPLRALLTFAVPMMVGNLFQQFYTMTDSVVVGRFVSEDALAAVGACTSLTNVFIAVAIGGGVGASVVVSRYFGSRDYGTMKRAVYTALLAFLAVSIALGGLGLLAGRRLMLWLQTPQDVFDMAMDYLNIYFLGLPFLFMYNVLSAMFNALGRSRIPLYLLIFSSVTNIVLDVYAVVELGMGVPGVAWATLIAQGISAVLSFGIFLREMRALPGTSGRCFDGPELGRMTRIALPSILQQSTVSIGMLLVQSVVNGFGSEVLAGYTAGMRLENLCIVPMAAMGNVMSSYTAQNLGAGRPDRVVRGYRVAYGIVAAFAVVLAVGLELFYTPLISLFLGDDGTPAAVATGANYLRFIGWFFVLIGLKMTTDGLLRGAGDMPMFTVANLVNLTLRVVIAVVCAPRFGVAMVWYAVPVGWAVNYLISFFEYRTGRWRRLTAAAVREEETA